MVILSLAMLSLILAIFYSMFLYVIKSWFPSGVRVFFISLFIAVTVFSSFYWLRGEPIPACFGLGVMVCLLGLSIFHALPYIPGWTITGAKFKFRGRPLHHSTMGIILIVVMITLDFPLDIQKPFAFVFSFLYGGGIFALTSQIPEIIEHKTLSW